MTQNIANTIFLSITRGLFSAAAFLPNLIAGIVILLIGIILGSVAKQLIIRPAEIWGLPQITIILNMILLYLPNVFVAAIIGLVGLVFARLASDVVLATTRGFSPDVSRTIDFF